MSDDSMTADYAPIGAYALVGDCHSAALVRDDTSIDWGCLRRFDGGSAFARILDAARGGHWAFIPRGEFQKRRRYIPGTMVLETTLTTAAGEVRVVDCFAMRRGGSRRPYRQLLRCVEGVSGEVALAMVLAPRFDYGELRPWLRVHASGTHSAVGGDDALVLSATAPVTIARDAVELRSDFVVRAGERARFALTWQEPHALDATALAPEQFDERLEETIEWWQRWVARGSYAGPYAEHVLRSALVLKTLTNGPTGAIIAAPTTSLPERIGGHRNWDYRYTWVRDSAFAMSALYVTGHPEVAEGFKAFIERATAGRAENLQIMYGCYGERRLLEFELKLEGYKGSRPVRVGNGAASQRQLDVYGELLEAAHTSRRIGHRVSDEEWRFLRSLVDAACAQWKEPDQSMWEFRSAAQHHVHSKVMCWVALDRGIRAAEEEGHACALETWKQHRDELRATIEREGVCAERGAFVQAFGTRALDASLLRLPLVGFVDAHDPRMVATVRAIEAELMHDGLVMRYDPRESDDGVDGPEGAFLMCSFWLVEVYARQGRLDDARALFERLLSLGNDLGLFAEEYDARAKELLGNFPQAFTHVALINAAVALGRAAEVTRVGPTSEVTAKTAPRTAEGAHRRSPLRD